MTPSGSAQSGPLTVLLDDFESGTIPLVNPSGPNPYSQYLWSQYPNDFTEGPDPGTAAITSLGLSHRGDRSLNINVTGGNLYLQFFPKNGLIWEWMRDHLQPGETWQMDTFNRMRFWLKVPEELAPAPSPGRKNLTLGTYVRGQTGDPSSAESGGGNHYYHFFNIPYTGEWHQLIFDTHPNHQRGGNGGYEWGDLLYPIAGEPGFNYFDALTRFYIEFDGPMSAYPGDFYVDGFELYKETNPGEHTADL